MTNSAPQIIPGPLTSKVSKKEAEAKLLAHPEFPKGSAFTLEEVEGRWIAAISRTAEFPPPSDEPSGPPEEVIPETPESEGPSSDESEEKPKHEKGKEKGSEKAELSHVLELLQTIVTALGLDASPEDSPVPGVDGPVAPPEGPPVAPEEKKDTHVIHEHSLKPGEAPPGSTPVGAPAFASVYPTHPWASVVGVKQAFTIEEPIGEASLAEVHEELQSLAAVTEGYKVAQLQAGLNSSGIRVARAIISK